jgi:hypothetical protein
MDTVTGLKKAIIFRFEKFPSNSQDKGKIVQILMHEIYVIVVFESCVAIFNSQSGDFLEEQGLLDVKFKYKCACLNHHTGDIMLLSYNTSKATNLVQTVIYQLKEIPAQD